MKLDLLKPICSFLNGIFLEESSCWNKRYTCFAVDVALTSFDLSPSSNKKVNKNVFLECQSPSLFSTWFNNNEKWRQADNPLKRKCFFAKFPWGEIFSGSDFFPPKKKRTKHRGGGGRVPIMQSPKNHQEIEKGPIIFQKKPHFIASMVIFPGSIYPIQQVVSLSLEHLGERSFSF